MLRRSKMRSDFSLKYYYYLFHKYKAEIGTGGIFLCNEAGARSGFTQHDE